MVVLLTHPVFDVARQSWCDPLLQHGKRSQALLRRKIPKQPVWRIDRERSLHWERSLSNDLTSSWGRRWRRRTAVITTASSSATVVTATVIVQVAPATAVPAIAARAKRHASARTAWGMG